MCTFDIEFFQVFLENILIDLLIAFFRSTVKRWATSPCRLKSTILASKCQTVKLTLELSLNKKYISFDISKISVTLRICRFFKVMKVDQIVEN